MRRSSKKKIGLITAMICCVAVLAVSVFLTVWGMGTGSQITAQKNEIEKLTQELTTLQSSKEAIIPRIEAAQAELDSAAAKISGADTAEGAAPEESAETSEEGIAAGAETAADAEIAAEPGTVAGPESESEITTVTAPETGIGVEAGTGTDVDMASGTEEGYTLESDGEASEGEYSEQY